MNELVLKARLLEKNMAYAQQQPQAQPTGQQSTGQDKDGDGLDDGSGLPIKRVTTITEDINNKTGKVAQREQKTKITNPTAMFDAEQADNRASDGVATNVVNGVSMKSDEMIEFYMGQLEKGMLGRMKAGVSNFLSGADTQAENFMPDPNNPGQMVPDPSRQAVAPEKNAASGNAQGTYKDPTGMAWQGMSSLKDPRFLTGVMATGGVGNLAATWNQSRKRNQGLHNDPTTGGLTATAQHPDAIGPAAPPTDVQTSATDAQQSAYLPTGDLGENATIGSRIKQGATDWLSSVTPKSLGGGGMPLTGNVRTNVLAGQNQRLGVNAAQTQEDAANRNQNIQAGNRGKLGTSSATYAGSENIPQPPAPAVRPPNPHEMAIMSSSDVIDPDFYAVLKYKREQRERDTTEAIRFAFV